LGRRVFNLVHSPVRLRSVFFIAVNVRAPTQQDATYARLRQWVTVGQFLPGERLKIHAIAEKLGVGVMPVRAALQRLAAEGALVNVPHAGMTVPKLSLAEFDDVLQTRLLLEGEAAERGAHRLDAAGVAELLALEQRMRDALRVNDAKGYLDANELFHLRLYVALADRNRVAQGRAAVQQAVRGTGLAARDQRSARRRGHGAAPEGQRGRAARD
jgi:DNA-binding GntR family transcriptional regulator